MHSGRPRYGVVQKKKYSRKQYILFLSNSIFCEPPVPLEFQHNGYSHVRNLFVSILTVPDRPECIASWKVNHLKGFTHDKK